jgi:hypothetical protein
MSKTQRSLILSRAYGREARKKERKKESKQDPRAHFNTLEILRELSEQS